MARTRPPALRDGDLASAVGNLRLDMHARYGLTVAVEWPASPYPLPLASAVTVYRFFQEALLNVVKHADVDDATVSLQVDETRSSPTSATRGRASTRSGRPDRGRHVGLGLLRERATAVRRQPRGRQRPGRGHDPDAAAAPAVRRGRPALPTCSPHSASRCRTRRRCVGCPTAPARPGPSGITPGPERGSGGGRRR